MPTVAELFEQMPDAVDLSSAGDIEATVIFDLSGEETGQYSVTLSGGKLTVAEGASEDASATIAMDSADYKEMAAGELNPMTAFMTGKIKVDGDLGTVMKMQSIFGM